MRPDPGADVMERILRDIGAGERGRISATLRRRGFLLLWDMADRAGVVDPVERAMFILEHAYPAMPDAHRESVRRQITADHAAGRWRGFRRPAPEGASQS